MNNLKAIKAGQYASYYADGHAKELATIAARTGGPASYYDAGDTVAPRWGGSLAAHLGLNGDYDRERFMAAGDGIYEINGESVNLNYHSGATSKTKAAERVVGYDCTLSAPKSVSVAMHFAEPALRARMLEVLQRANDKAMAHNERYAGARVTRDGVTTWERVGAIAYTSFTHRETRRGDPDYHTHNVISRAVLCADGEHRSLDVTQMMLARHEVDAVYKAELARGLSELGLAIEITDDGPELAQVPKTLRDAMSTARAQMDEWARQHYGCGIDECSEQQRERANRATRGGAKIIRTDAQQHELLSRRLADAGYDIDAICIQPDALVEELTGRRPLMSAREAVEAAYMDAHERDGLIKSRHWIAATAMRRTGYAVEMSDINTVIDDRVASGDLRYIQDGDGVPRVRGGSVDRHSIQMTSQYYLDLERKPVDLYRRAIGASRAMCSAEAVTEAIQRNEEALNSRMTAGQVSMLQGILLSHDGVVVVEGDPGTGKTFSMRVAKELADANGVKLLGLAPSKQAQQALNESGIKSQAIQYANLSSAWWDQVDKDTIIVVDEAGMTSLAGTGSLVSVLERAREKGAKVALVGDRKQVKAVGAGDPFSMIADAAGTRGALVRLDEMRRGRTDEMRELHVLSRDDQAAAVQRLIDAGEGAVYSSASESRRLDHVARKLRSMTPEERLRHPVIVDTNRDRVMLTGAIRKAIGARDRYVIEAFEAYDLSRAAHLDPASYSIGDAIRFTGATQRGRGGFKKGDVGVITERYGNAFTVELGNGVTREFVPMRDGLVASLGDGERVGLDVGEPIRFTAPAQSLDGEEIHNGDRARIDRIDEAGVAELTMLTSDGQEVGKRRVDLRAKGVGLRHGYAATVHSVQGASLDGGTYYSTNTSANTFLVGITRFKDHAAFELVSDLSTQLKIEEFVAKARTVQEKAVVGDLLDTPAPYIVPRKLAGFWEPQPGDATRAPGFVPVAVSRLEDEAFIEAKMREAVEKYGNGIEVSGSERFVGRATRVAEEAGIRTAFSRMPEVVDVRSIDTAHRPRLSIEQ